jgi:hypothetical protein
LELKKESPSLLEEKTQPFHSEVYLLLGIEEVALPVCLLEMMPDVDDNNAKNQMTNTNHHPSASALFGNIFADVNPSVAVAAFVVIEATIFAGLCLLDPELASMLVWCSIAVVTFSVGIHYTMQWLQREIRSSHPSICFCNKSCVVWVVFWLVVFGTLLVVHMEDADPPPAVQIAIFLLFILLAVSIPVLIVNAVQYFKSNLAVLYPPPQGEINNSKQTTTLPSLLLVRSIDSILSRTLAAVGVIVSILTVFNLVLMAQATSWTEICFSVLFLGLFFGALFYLLVMFFISHRPRRTNKKINKVVAEMSAIEESQPVLGQGDTPSNSLLLLVV